MPTNVDHKLGLAEPVTYRIKVQGRLGESWSDWFGQITITTGRLGDGTTVTTLTCPVPDQPALQAIFRRISDLGLLILEVKRVTGARTKPRS